MPNDDARHQVAALPVRDIGGGPEVCLLTTRETRRWTIPKGWPMQRHKDRDAAAIEARQEAGLVGTMHPKPLGSFLYWKRLTDHLQLVRVKVYRLDVQQQLPSWKEAGEREIGWFPAATAAEMVQEPGLATLIAALAPENA